MGRWISNSLAPVVLAALCLIAVSPAARAACSNPPGAEAEIVYNTTSQRFQYCDDTNWIAMTVPGSGSGGCANPARAEGKMVYNPSARVMQGCAGNVWRAMGPVGGQSGSGWKMLAAGGLHICGIKQDGMAWCWGSRALGRLGDGGATTGLELTPTQVAGGATWKTISAANEHSCGIQSDDTLWCWGYAFNGRLGNGDTSASTYASPVQIGAATWKTISAGGEHTCGIQSDDTLWCWGTALNGQLGNGTTSPNVSTPVQIGAATWKTISAGAAHTCGIQSDDTAWCWGDGGNGKLGDGGEGTQTSPVAVSGGATWKVIGAGRFHSCGIQADDTAWCWGYNFYGQGGGVTPTAVPGGGTWKALRVGAYHNCGIKSDDTLWCWGGNESGQLGNNDTTNTGTPVAVFSGGSWGAVGAGGGYSCGIRPDGSGWCWGTALNGELGVNSYEIKDTPTALYGGGTWKALSTGMVQSCAIKSDDTAWCWGKASNFYPNGFLVSVNAPLAGPVAGSWKDTATNDSRASGGDIGRLSCGIKTDDSAWCWGYGGSGQLGNGTTPNIGSGQVTGGTVWKKISVGLKYACGIKTDDTLWCWGTGGSGQRGDGSTSAAQSTPVQESGGDTWKFVSTGITHACGIQTDDTLWCWGAAANGRLGNGATSPDQTMRVQIGSATWKSVSAGETHTCGIQTNSSLWCWGEGADGKLGNGATSPDQIAPVQIGAASWSTVSAGHDHTCGIRTDNSLWCWGADDYGQLGNGAATTGDQTSPINILSSPGLKTVDAGEEYTCGITMDDGIWCWGHGDKGQIGDNLTGFSMIENQIWCGDPGRKAGTLLYNSSNDVMQYCDGASWVQIGAPPPPPSDLCAGSPSPGDVCADGSYYIGQVGGNDIYATAAASQSSQTWNNGTSNWTVTGFTSATDGPGNTAGLVASADAGSPYDAAEYCDGLSNVHGHSDWYLPAKDELNLFRNGGTPVAGVLTGGSNWYWSSSEFGSTNAWMQRFSDATQLLTNKNTSRLVRCVRR